MNNPENYNPSKTEIDIGHYLKAGWSLFIKDPGILIGYTILYFIISLLVSLIPFIGLFSTFIQMTLTAGYFIFCHNLIQGTAQFSQFFDGFNRFIQILLYGIILFLFAIPFFILFFQTVIPLEYFREIASGGWNPEYIGEEILYFMEDSLGILFIMLVGFLYLYISYTFVLPLIVINKLDFWAAMETSRKWIAKNFGYWILFYLVLFVFIAAGSAISCGLGIFILFPYLYCCLYVAYQDLPVTQENEQNN